MRGRDAERDRIIRALRALADGPGDVVVVRGAAGVGKSRLLQDATAQAAAAGVRVAAARTDRDAHLIPLAPIMDAFGSGERPISDRVRLASVASDPEARYWLVQQLQDDIEQVALATGVMVVIDDLQWCDASSLAVLRSLSARLRDVPVLWLVALRTGEHDPSVSATVAELGSHGQLIDLAPLSSDATSAMICDLLGAAPDETVMDAARRTDNVPLLVVELVRGLLDEGLVEVADGVATMPKPASPAIFGSSVRESVRRLSRSGQQILQVGSVLGRSFTVEALSAMLALPAQRLLPGVQEAIDAGILVDEGRSLAFRHDVVREAAESLIPSSLRSALIRQGAEELLRRGADPLSVASRIADVAEPGDVRAALLLRDAALDLAATDAAQASVLALRATEVAANTPELAGVVADLVPLLWHSGRIREARTLLEGLEGRIVAEDEARLLLAAARLRSDGSPTTALQLVEAALELPGVSRPVRGRLFALRALNAAQGAEPAVFREALASARSELGESADPASIATLEVSESTLAFHENRFDDATRLVTTALARMASRSELTTTGWLPEGLWVAFLADSLGDTRRAVRIAEAKCLETDSNHLARAMASWMMLKARVLFDQGDLEEAKTVAESALDVAEDLELDGLAELTGASVLFRAALVQGDRAGMHQHRHHAEALLGRPTLERVGSWLLALEADAIGAVDAAFALTGSAWQSLELPVFAMSQPADFADDVHLLRIALRAGQHQHVARLERVARARAEANPRNDLCAGVWLHVRGVVRASPGDLRDAVGHLRRVPRRLVLAAALEDLGDLLHEGSPTVAVETWQEALSLFSDAAATRDAERVRRRLRDVGVSQRGPSTAGTDGGLTARERQVAERVAAGLTTQQIASDLFISAHTVTSHVRHVYAKWGVSSRAELSARYRSEQEPDLRARH
jgi:DNA-binding CsgD family transcriptional regulator/tetratricopeptide (TPR) repeat protein